MPAAADTRPHKGPLGVLGIVADEPWFLALNLKTPADSHLGLDGVSICGAPFLVFSLPWLCWVVSCLGSLACYGAVICSQVGFRQSFCNCIN